VVRAFGPDRLMWGSDWPVCLLTAPYGRVLDVTRELLSRHLAAEDLEKVFATNARRFYGV
jgi:L-fuconolactonase